VLEDSSAGTSDVTVVFFDRPHFPKRALFSLHINLAKKQLGVKNYAGVGPEFPDRKFSTSLIQSFSETANLTGQGSTLSFWFPQDDLVIFVR